MSGLNLPTGGLVRGRARTATGFYNGSGSVLETTVGYDAFASIQAWRQYYFGTMADSGAAANLADFEQDGLVNLLEWSLGLNPLRSDAGDAPRPVDEGGYLTMTLTKRPGVIYSVQSAASPDGTSFSTTNTTILVDNTSTLKVRDNFPIGGGAQRFMRVKVTALP